MGKKAQKYWKLEVSGLKKPMPLSAYCARVFPILGSKSAVQKAIVAGRLLRNGQHARIQDQVKNGDWLELRGSGVQQARSFDAELEVVFEDNWLVLINKPAGIAVNGNRQKTVENAMAGLATSSTEPDALPRPVAVHRIDVPTKGLVLLAKTKSVLIRLGQDFENNRIKKEYLAVVHGRPEATGRIDLAIEGKQAITHFETLQVAPSRVYRHLAMLRLMPVTGRTHQLRIHLQKRGHLIVGDKAYAGQQSTILGKGLFLCACQLRFVHPVTSEEMLIRIEPPERFHRLLDRERERFS